MKRDKNGRFCREGFITWENLKKGDQVSYSRLGREFHQYEGKAVVLARIEELIALGTVDGRFFTWYSIAGLKQGGAMILQKVTTKKRQVSMAEVNAMFGEDVVIKKEDEQ